MRDWGTERCRLRYSPDPGDEWIYYHTVKYTDAHPFDKRCHIHTLPGVTVTAQPETTATETTPTFLQSLARTIQP